MKRLMHIATLLAAFGLLGVTAGWSLDNSGKEPAGLKHTSAQAAHERESPAAAEGVQAPPATDASGTRGCAVNSQLASAALHSGRGLRRYTPAGTPLTCRLKCGDDDLCMYCCLHPVPGR